MKGSLQLKNGKWYAVVYIREEGILKQKWIKTNLKTDCKEFEKQQVLDSITYGIQNKNKSENINQMKVEKFYNFWLSTKKNRVQPMTYANYEKYGKRVNEFFFNKNISVENLSVIDVERFMSFLYSKNLSENTIKQYYISLRSCIQFAYKNNYININVVDKVQKPKSKNSKKQFYSSEEMKKLFDVIENEEIKLPIMLSAIYGLRRSEVLGLKWSAVDFENNKITIEHKIVEVKVDGKYKLIKSNTLKTDSSNRQLPILPQVKFMLNEQLKKNKENSELLGRHYNNKDYEYVCIDNFGKLITPNRLTHSFFKILKKNNLKHIRFHDLRHSCASIMLASGISMKQIQEWLGHSNYATTANIYSHLDFTTKLNSAKNLSKVYSFLNKKYNIVQESNVFEDNLSEDEIIIKIKSYQRLLKKVRARNKLIV